MELNRHKEPILDFLRYMRRRAKVIHINELAASLSFTTTLSLVPMVTLAFSFLAALPSFLNLKRLFQVWLSDNLIPQNIAEPIMVYLNQFAYKAKGLTLFGSLGLIVGVFFTLLTVENAFNRIWSVKHPRPFNRRLGIHLFATLVGPFLLGLSIYLSSMVLSASKGLIGPLSAGFSFVAAFFPIILSSLSFTVIYKLLPYEDVEWGDAFWGGLVAALGFEIAKFGFGWFASAFPLYKTVYGAFAILPLLLVWIYITWWVTLVGATLVANMPIIRAWDRGQGSLDAEGNYQ